MRESWAVALSFKAPPYAVFSSGRAPKDAGWVGTFPRRMAPPAGIFQRHPSAIWVTLGPLFGSIQKTNSTSRCCIIAYTRRERIRKFPSSGPGFTMSWSKLAVECNEAGRHRLGRHPGLFPAQYRGRTLFSAAKPGRAPGSFLSRAVTRPGGWPAPPWWPRLFPPIRLWPSRDSWPTTVSPETGSGGTMHSAG